MKSSPLTFEGKGKKIWYKILKIKIIMFKNYIFSLMVSLLIIPAYTIGVFIGAYIVEGFYNISQIFFDISYDLLWWLTVFLGGGLGGYLGGSAAAYVINIIFKKFNLYAVMILPTLLTIFVIYNEVAYANENGWGIIAYGAFFRTIVCTSVFFYLLRKISQKRLKKNLIFCEFF